MERIEGHRGLTESEAARIDSAFFAMLIREHGEQQVDEARARWLRTLRVAGETLRPSDRG